MKFPSLEVMNGPVKASPTPPVLHQTFALKQTTETHFHTQWFHGQPWLLFNGDKNKTTSTHYTSSRGGLLPRCSQWHNFQSSALLFKGMQRQQSIKQLLLLRRREPKFDKAVGKAINIASNESTVVSGGGGSPVFVVVCKPQNFVHPNFSMDRMQMSSASNLPLVPPAFVTQNRG